MTFLTLKILNDKFVLWIYKQSFHSRWSFGILLWEIVTLGALPYSTLNDQTLAEYLLIHKNFKLIKPKNCGSKLYELIQEKCCAYDAHLRPDFRAILRHLHDLNLDPEVRFVC